MSTLPPNHREEQMRAPQVNMAVATSTKSKPASKASSNAASKQKTQMHRRSRTGLSAFFGYSIVAYTFPVTISLSPLDAGATS